MLKKIAATTALASVVLLSGCATGYSPVGVGLITDVKGPITATELNGNKTGTACAKTIVGIINSGDASIQAAKADGGIKNLATADYHTKGDRKSTRLNSSHVRISYAVFCLKKKNKWKVY